MGAMTKQELEAMIKEIVSEALKPFEQRQTDWAAKIFSQPSPTASPQKGLGAARLIRALVAGKGDPARAADFARKAWGDDAVAKALNESNAAEGGYLVPPQFSEEIIEMLRPQAVVRRMNPRIMPMNSGTLDIPKLTGGAQASYVGESDNITKSQPGTGMIHMSAKKLAALVPISNDLIRDTSGRADQVVREDVVSAMSAREDIGFIRDDGTQNKPKGMRYWAVAGNIIAANPTVNLANVTTDLGKLILALRKGNARMIRPGWLLGPTAAFYLESVRDANGNFAFKDEMAQGKLFTFPFAVSNQIPENLGAGGNESEVYFVDFADAVIGENTQLIIDVSAEATYWDGTQLVSAFSRDETVVKVIARHDFAMRHDESVAILTGVTWGK